MKVCKNDYTIWASLKKLKSSRENGETGRYQNDKRWEMVDFCGSPWVPTWPFDLRGPGFIPDQGLKSHRPNSTFKKNFFLQNVRWLRGVMWGTYYAFKNMQFHSLSGLFSKFWSPFSLAVTHATVPSTHSEPVVSIYVVFALEWRMTAI